MEQTRRVRVVVEMIREGDPISGTVETDDAAPRAFMGWMDLVAALEEARGERDRLVGDRSAGTRRRET